MKEIQAGPIYFPDAEHKPRIWAWIAALRSGGFKQAKHALAVMLVDGEMSFCCLGVATECFLRAGHVGFWLKARGESKSHGVVLENLDSALRRQQADDESNEEDAREEVFADTWEELPPEVSRWLFGDCVGREEERLDALDAVVSVSYTNPVVWWFGELRSLSYLNDTAQATFDQIADAIEASFDLTEEAVQLKVNL